MRQSQIACCINSFLSLSVQTCLIIQVNIYSVFLCVCVSVCLYEAGVHQ